MLQTAPAVVGLHFEAELSQVQQPISLQPVSSKCESMHKSSCNWAGNSTVRDCVFYSKLMNK